MAKLTLTDLTAGYSSTALSASNNALIEAALENTVSRDGTAPNAMSAALDLNSNKINNLADGTSGQDAVTLAQLNAASIAVETVAASAVTFADAGGDYAATTVEAALAELASIDAGEGASIIGIEDTNNYFTGTDVESALNELGTPVTATTAQLEDVAHDINTRDAKAAGYMCFNTTTSKPVWAIGSTEGSHWYDATGTLAHEPVV